MSNQIRIPASQIVSGSYTSNGEYVYKGNTKKIYKGYYFKYKGKSYVGKTFDPNAVTEEIMIAKKVTYTSKDLLYDLLLLSLIVPILGKITSYLKENIPKYVNKLYTKS